MKNKLSVILLAIVFQMTGIAAEQSSNAVQKLPFMRQLQETISASENSEACSVDFDSRIYEKCSSSFSDIRIAGKNNIEIPYLIKKETVNHTENIKRNCTSKILSLKKIDENKYEITVELADKEPIPGEAVFKTPCRNYEKTVSVYGGNDLRNWKLLSENAAIFDYSQMIDLADNTVTFPQEKFKYYKFTVDNFKELKKSPQTQFVTETRQGQDYSKIEKTEQTAATFKITDITLVSYASKETVIKDKTISYPFLNFSKEKDKDNEKNDVLIIETFRQPLTQINILTSSTNFCRAVSIYGSDDKKNWSYVNSGKISNITLGKFKKEDLELTFPEKRSRYYKLVIGNGDSPAIELNDIKLSGNVYSARFIMPPKNAGPLNIFYGAAKLASPVYDIAMVLEKAQVRQFRIFTMKDPEPNPFYITAPEKTDSPYSKYLFIGAVSLMVIILAWILFRGLKKIEALPDGQ